MAVSCISIYKKKKKAAAVDRCVAACSCMYYTRVGYTVEWRKSAARMEFNLIGCPSLSLGLWLWLIFVGIMNEIISSCEWYTA